MVLYLQRLTRSVRPRYVISDFIITRFWVEGSIAERDILNSMALRRVARSQALPTLWTSSCLHAKRPAL